MRWGHAAPGGLSRQDEPGSGAPSTRPRAGGTASGGGRAQEMGAARGDPHEAAAGAGRCQNRQISGTMKTETTKNQIISGRPSFQ
jgi:hypothetical protein